MIERMTDKESEFEIAKDLLWAWIVIAGIVGVCFGAYCLLSGGLG